MEGIGSGPYGIRPLRSSVSSRSEPQESRPDASEFRNAPEKISDRWEQRIVNIGCQSGVFGVSLSVTAPRICGTTSPELRKASEEILDRWARECNRWRHGVSIMASGVLASVSVRSYLIHLPAHSPNESVPRIPESPARGDFGPWGPQEQRLASWCRSGSLVSWRQSLCVSMCFTYTLTGPM